MELKAANKRELEDAEAKLASARMDEICIEEVLDFCERILCNVPMLWRDLHARFTAETAEGSLSRRTRLRRPIRLWNRHNLYVFQSLKRRFRGEKRFGSANGN
jgi:hypothetical protein